MRQGPFEALETARWTRWTPMEWSVHGVSIWSGVLSVEACGCVLIEACDCVLMDFNLRLKFCMV